MKVICIRKCYAFNRMWKPGETRAHLGDEAPPHFEAVDVQKKEVKKKEPKTFKEIQDVQNKNEKEVKEKKDAIMKDKAEDLLS